MTEIPRITEESTPRDQNRLRRLGFGVLGALGTLYGTNALVSGLFAPIAPVASIALLGLGAGSVYGGYKAFQHRSEIEAGVDADPSKTARLTKMGRYLGGAALLVAGLTAANIGLFAPIGVVAGAGIWLAGVATSAIGIGKMSRSFEIQPAAGHIDRALPGLSTVQATA